MRVAIIGATGNAGTSLIHRLGRDDGVTSIVGLARRVPEVARPKTEWVAADIVSDDLVPHLRGADVVVHLAWLIQPSRRPAVLRATNVEGSRRVFRATARAGVPALVYASSVGAYSPGPKDGRVTEDWPTEGVAGSFYSRHKAQVERLLDAFEAENPGIRVVRLRPGLIFKRASAAEQRRLFAGPLLPGFVVRHRLIPIVPNIPALRFQAVHSHDVAEAYRLAVVSDARGAFNVAAEPVLDPPRLARLLHARLVRIPERALRGAVAASWRLRLQPTPEGWLDLALQSPLLDTTRARSVLGWAPRHSAEVALLDLLDGIGANAGDDTPALAPDAGGPLRLRELLSGVGRTSR